MLILKIFYKQIIFFTAKSISMYLKAIDMTLYKFLKKNLKENYFKKSFKITHLIMNFLSFMKDN